MVHREGNRLKNVKSLVQRHRLQAAEPGFHTVCLILDPMFFVLHEQTLYSEMLAESPNNSGVLGQKYNLSTLQVLEVIFTL